MSRTVWGVRRGMMCGGEGFCTRGSACQHTHGNHDLEQSGEHIGPARPGNGSDHVLEDTHIAKDNNMIRSVTNGSL